MKSLVIAPTLHSSNWRVFAKTLAFIILGGFHRWNLGEICQILQVKSTRFHGEIHQISWWNPLDFRGEIPHPAFIKLKSFCWNTCFYNFGWISQVISGWNLPDFRVKSGRFHGWNPLDFTDFTWNPPDFTWNPLDFMDFMKSAGCHEICQISWWNLPDFMNVSFWVMIKYRSFYRKTNKYIFRQCNEPNPTSSPVFYRAYHASCQCASPTFTDYLKFNLIWLTRQIGLIRQSSQTSYLTHIWNVIFPLLGYDVSYLSDLLLLIM